MPTSVRYLIVRSASWSSGSLAIEFLRRIPLDRVHSVHTDTLGPLHVRQPVIAHTHGLLGLYAELFERDLERSLDGV